MFTALKIIYDFLQHQRIDVNKDHPLFTRLARRLVVWRLLYDIKNAYADDVLRYRQMLELVNQNFLNHKKMLNFESTYVKFSLRFTDEAHPAILGEYIRYQWHRFPSKSVLKGILKFAKYKLKNWKTWSKLPPMTER